MRSCRRNSRGVVAALVVLAIATGGSCLAGDDGTEAPAAILSKQTSTTTIAGVCVENTPSPIAGLRVTLWKNPRGKQGERYAEGTTDDDGHFLFRNLTAPAIGDLNVDWSWLVVVTHPEFEMHVKSVSPFRGDRRLTFVMSPGATLSGEVVDSAGRLIAGATVWSSEIDEPSTKAGICSATTNSRGAFSIPGLRGLRMNSADAEFSERSIPAPTVVFVQHPEYARQAVFYRPHTGPFRVELKPGGVIQGRVTDDVTGTPASGAIVTLQPAKPGRRVPGEIREMRTNDRGEYRFGSVAAAEYTLSAIAVDRVPGRMEPVTVVPGETQNANLTIIQGSLIEGRVHTLNGGPVSHDPQTRERLSINVSQNFTSLVDVADDGRFRVRVTPGHHRFQIQSSVLWERTWRRESLVKGIDVANGQTVPLSMRILEEARPRPEPTERPGPELPEQVDAERPAAEKVRRLGGTLFTNFDGHVIHVGMDPHQAARNVPVDEIFDLKELLLASREFSHLEWLSIHGKQITDESMAQIATLRALRVLFIDHPGKLTREGVQHLARLENLEWLMLESCGLGNDSLEIIGAFPRVRHLSLYGNDFADEDLAHLAGMSQLEVLHLGGRGPGKGPITNAGLKHLERLSNLNTLGVQGTRVTNSGLTRLREIIPGLRQVYR